MFGSLQDLPDDYFDEPIPKEVMKRNKFSRSNNGMFTVTELSKGFVHGELIAKKYGIRKFTNSFIFIVTSSKATTAEEFRVVYDEDRLSKEETVKLVTLCRNFAKKYPSETVFRDPYKKLFYYIWPNKNGKIKLVNVMISLTIPFCEFMKFYWSYQ